MFTFFVIKCIFANFFFFLPFSIFCMIYLLLWKVTMEKGKDIELSFISF